MPEYQRPAKAASVILNAGVACALTLFRRIFGVLFFHSSIGPPLSENSRSTVNRSNVKCESDKRSEDEAEHAFILQMSKHDHGKEMTPYLDVD